MATEGLKWSPW